RRSALEHVRRYAGVYFFLTVLFAMGVAFGALAVGALDATQRLELGHYLEFFLQTLEQPGEAVPAQSIVRQALLSNWRTAGLIFLLGLTVVGVPLIPAIVFLRGFIVGFAVGFLVSSDGWRGLLISLLAILPQNVLIVPALIVLSAAAVTFSARLVRPGPGRPSLWRFVISYLTTAAACFIALAVASVLEGYVAPLFLRLVAGYSDGF
ncbi:MAG TPA: stage II sporulation protein M, partial [Bacillota bacterium]